MKKAPDVHREAEWDDVDLPFAIGSGRTLASGAGDESRLRVKFFRRRSDGHLIGRVWFGDGSEGPPLHAHGGAIAYILDEAMGAAGWAENFPVVAAELGFEYFHMTPLYQDHQIEAWIERPTERRVIIKTKLMLTDGRIAVTGTGQFHILKKSKFQALLKQLPKGQIEAQSLYLQRPLKWAPDDSN